MKTYNICNQPDEKLFYMQCRALEKNIPDLEKCDIITDVDGSGVQEYIIDGKSIKVHNDLYIGALYIKSDIDLEKYFN